MSIHQSTPQRNDSVMAKIAPGDVVPGRVVDRGPRYTIAVFDETVYVEVDESNVWKNGESDREITIEAIHD